MFNELDYTTVDYAYKVRVKPSTNIAWSISTQYKLYDINENEISTGTALTVATTANTAYIAFVGTIADKTIFMLNEGTTEEDWVKYNSPQDNFKVTADLLSVSTNVRDIAYESNGVWWKDAYVGYDTTEIKGSTFTLSGTTGVAYQRFVAGSILTALPNLKAPADNDTAVIALLKIGNVTYTPIDENSVDSTAEIDANPFTFAVLNTGDVLYIVSDEADASAFMTALANNDVEFIYELDEIVTTEIEKDGSLIQESVTTLVQLNNIATEYNIEFALNSTKQIEINTTKGIYLQAEIDGLEDDVSTLDTEQIAQGVRITDNEADINTLDSDLTTAQGDITNIEAKTDYITISQPVDLDDVEEYANSARSLVVYTSGTDGLSVESGATGTTRTMTSTIGANYLEITVGRKSGGTIFQNLVLRVNINGSLIAMYTANIDDVTYDLIQWAGWVTFSSSTAFKWYKGVKFLDGVRTDDTQLKLIKIVAYYNN